LLACLLWGCPWNVLRSFRTKQHYYFLVSSYSYSSKTSYPRFEFPAWSGTSSKDDEVDGKMLGYVGESEGRHGQDFFPKWWRNVKKTLKVNGDKEKGTLGNEGTRD
jgi:hypothetical protein